MSSFTKSSVSPFSSYAAASTATRSASAGADSIAGSFNGPLNARKVRTEVVVVAPTCSEDPSTATSTAAGTPTDQSAADHAKRVPIHHYKTTSTDSGLACTPAPIASTLTAGGQVNHSAGSTAAAAAALALLVAAAACEAA